MARKGITVWEVKREIRREGEDYFGVQWYALRTDGKLVEKYQTKNLDGSARYDYGWKLTVGAANIVGMMPNEMLKHFESRGYKKASS